MPALFLAKSAVLGAFSAGRGTALVLDIGHGGSRVVPVIDGYSMIGGANLLCFLEQATADRYERPIFC